MFHMFGWIFRWVNFLLLAVSERAGLEIAKLGVAKCVGIIITVVLFIGGLFSKQASKSLVCQTV